PQKTALNFDRSQRQVVVVPSDSALHINGPITIAAWVRCGSPDDGGHIVSCRLPEGKANYQFAYKVPYANPTEMGKKGQIHFARMDGLISISRRVKIVYSNRTFNPSAQWKFIAASHDNKEVRFYVDGRLIETHELELFQESVIADMVIGADNVADDRSRFIGDMGELAVFKRILAAEEVGEMYKAGKP
ncbi:MAG: LamG domain-containing protein, partial [Anaerohalosphaera sp.]|nr:LamG domain-containing protein [Anaerohalosphaera sp.]